MHYTKDYSKSPSPQFDAVEDIKEYLGTKYDLVASEMSKVKSCARFAMWCSFAGIQGLPVKAWYEHFNGGGTWKQDEVDAPFKE